MLKFAPLAFLLLVTPALAQQPPDPLITDFINNSQAEQVMHGNSTRAANALLEAYAKLQQENARLKAEAVKAAPKPAE